MDNPQLVAVYVKDVYVYLRHLEEIYPVRQNYMTPSTANAAKPEISPRMRTILIDWLIQVHNRFGLLQETLFLTIGILDRYLQEKIREVGRKRLQLVGITSMWIAAKVSFSSHFLQVQLNQKTVSGLCSRPGASVTTSHWLFFSLIL